MWTVQKVAKERENYIVELITPTPSKKEYTKRIEDMMDTQGITDERLKQYIFNLNLDDRETAYLLDFAQVPADNAFQSIFRVILGLILLLYCLPVSISYYILRLTTSYRLKYKKPGAIPLGELVIVVLLSSILSTAFYFALFSFIGPIE